MGPLQRRMQGLPILLSSRNRKERVNMTRNYFKEGKKRDRPSTLKKTTQWMREVKPRKSMIAIIRVHSSRNRKSTRSSKPSKINSRRQHIPPKLRSLRRETRARSVRATIEYPIHLRVLKSRSLRSCQRLFPQRTRQVKRDNSLL